MMPSLMTILFVTTQFLYSSLEVHYYYGISLGLQVYLEVCVLTSGSGSANGSIYFVSCPLAGGVSVQVKRSMLFNEDSLSNITTYSKTIWLHFFFLCVLQLAYCLQSLRFPQLQHLFVVPVISAFLVTHIPAIWQWKAISGVSLVPVGNLIPLTANCSSHPLQHKPNRKIPFAETHLCHLHSWVNLRFLLRLALRSPQPQQSQ